jgi:hypothetical protein
MMDRITEEVLTSLIKRVEALESLVPTKKENVGTKKYPEKKGMITEGQVNFIKGLGGVPDPNLTSKQASEYIDKLKTQKDHSQRINQSSTDELGDAPGFPAATKKLTQEEIDALPEEAFL